MDPKKKSRMGLGFLAGMIGAYIFPEVFVKIAYWLGLYELNTTTNINYLISVFSGLFTGILTITISKERQLRILIFVIGTLFLMDFIAYFSNPELSITRMINRMILNSSALLGGIICYLFVRKKTI